jgi:hypothetical protein
MIDVAFDLSSENIGFTDSGKLILLDVLYPIL